MLRFGPQYVNKLLCDGPNNSLSQSLQTVNSSQTQFLSWAEILHAGLKPIKRYQPKLKYLPRLLSFTIQYGLLSFTISKLFGVFLFSSSKRVKSCVTRVSKFKLSPSFSVISSSELKSISLLF